MTIERIIKKFKENHPKTDVSLLERAFAFAASAHKDQVRKNGVPYMSGNLMLGGKEYRIAVFENTRKSQDKHPDYNIILSKDKQ